MFLHHILCDTTEAPWSPCKCFPVQLLGALQSHSDTIHCAPHLEEKIMPSTTELISLLSSTRIEDSVESRLLSEPQRHVLSFQYPACEHLPEGSQLRLEPPTTVTQRPEPSIVPEDEGVYDTDFFVTVPIRPRNPFALTEFGDQIQALIAAVDSLSCNSGTSEMEVVSFRPAETAETHWRVVLKTASSVQGFVLEPSQWEQLIDSYTHEWIRLLHHLVHRASLRAVYHVRELLFASYGAEAAEAEEALWPTQWDSATPRGVTELFNARLRDATGGVSLLQPGGDTTVLARLPCGHSTLLRKIQIDSLTDEGRVAFGCPECGKSVLQQADYRELIWRNERDRHQKFVSETQAWQGLEHPPESRDEGLYPAEAVFQAISAVLGSMRQPMLVSPPELSFLHFPETRKVVMEFERTLTGSTQMMTITPARLFDALIGLALGTKADEDGQQTLADCTLPPTWMDSLELWLTRTVNFLDERACFWKDREHHGLHSHGQCLHYNKRDAFPLVADADEEEAEPLFESDVEEEEDLVQDLIAGIQGASLQDNVVKGLVECPVLEKASSESAEAMDGVSDW